MEFGNHQQFVDFLASSAEQLFARERFGIDLGVPLSVEALKADPHFLRIARRVSDRCASGLGSGARRVIADAASSGLQLSTGEWNRAHPMARELPELVGYLSGRSLDSVKGAAAAELGATKWRLQEEMRAAKFRLGVKASIAFGCVAAVGLGAALLARRFRTPDTNKSGGHSRGAN